MHPDNRQLIWIVDDDPDDTYFYVEALKALGYQGLYSCFTDPASALERLLDHHPLPGLLIVDYYMPKMTGIDLVEALRKNELLDKMEAVLMSGGINKKLLEYAEFAGVQVFQKPASLQEVIRLFATLSAFQPEEK